MAEMSDVESANSRRGYSGRVPSVEASGGSPGDVTFRWASDAEMFPERAARVMLNAVVPTERSAAPPPTVFPDLNELLAELVARAGWILGENFVGAYLTGSFALGDADLQSDCDFLVVTEDQVTAGQEQALRELHDEIPTRPGHWTHDLEGSYAPRAELATLAALDKQWLYVDRGWREMQWSTHCNTEAVRWTLRERGITLVGPDPRQLVAEVPAAATIAFAEYAKERAFNSLRLIRRTPAT